MESDWAVGRAWVLVFSERQTRLEGPDSSHPPRKQRDFKQAGCMENLGRSTPRSTSNQATTCSR
jgi:hypothetical protein